jgi:hypothetical protein
MNPRIITLTSDFGLKDPFVGMIKGVILGIHPEVRVVDITHEIPPQDILAGAFVIHSTYPYFPKGTIHMAVVDPTVGSPRRPLLMLSGGQVFIGPDNGIFSLIFRDDRDAKVFHITASHYFLRTTGSTTFHGRDIFAPVAAWLSRGVECEKLGVEILDPVRIEVPEARTSEEEIQGEVLYVDRYGNLITNIPGTLVGELIKRAGKEGESYVLKIRDINIQGVGSFYAESPVGTPGVLVNSLGLLEVYVYRGNASVQLGSDRGEKVVLHLK